MSAFPDLNSTTEAPHATRRVSAGSASLPVFHDVLAAIPEALVVVDTDCRIRELSRWTSQLFGFSREDLIGQPVDLLIQPEGGGVSRESVSELLQKAQTGPTQARQSLRGRRKDGSSFPMDVSRQIGVFAGEKLNFFAFKDMTEQEQALSVMNYIGEELKERNRELEQFIYLASHDLKEPLRSISSFVQLLNQTLGGELDDNTVYALRFIGDGVQRMNSLIHNLLEYSRTGQGGAAEDVAMDGLIAEVKQNLDATIRDSGATICADNPPTIHGVRSDLIHLFQNLLSNAIKFRKPAVAPVIEIDAKPQGEGWKFCIRDNGIGIKPEQCEEVFQPFRRLHSREEYEGTGIGLAHCRKIVERHDGRIWAVSRPEGGTEFCFTINESSLF